MTIASTAGVQVCNIPAALSSTPNWVNWRLEPRAGGQTGKPTKVPYSALTGRKASPTDPSTWATFEQALEACERNPGLSGIGFVLTPHDPFVGVDLDHCVDKETGVIAPWAKEIIDDINSYTEVSPSGEGIRIFVSGELPPGGRRSGPIEMYSEGRYLTVTGDHVDGTPLSVEERTAELARVHSRTFGNASREQAELGAAATGGTTAGPSDVAILPGGSTPALGGGLTDLEIIDKARRAKNGANFDALWAGDVARYPSQSEADLALCSILRFWAAGDRNQIDRLFRQSGLMRPKWDERHYADGRTYGQGVIEKAMAGTRQFYGTASPAYGQEHVQAAIAQALAAAEETCDPAVAYGVAAYMALLPAAEYAKVKSQLRAIFGKRLNLNDFERAVKEARRNHHAAPVAGDGDAGLPQIVVTDRPLRDKSDDAVRALVAANDPPTLFVRSGVLVRIRTDEAGRFMLEPMNDAAVKGALTRSANFVRTGERGPIHISPPDDVVGDVKNLVTWPGIPPLVGLVEAPVLRPDGTVLDTQGYDPVTRLVYAPAAGLVVPPLPAEPGNEAVSTAQALLEGAIGDFPFVDDASKANALALLLTLILRPAIAGPVPLALLDKPQGGTGASLFASLVARIATGQPAAMMGAPGNEEEWRKQITTVLLGGPMLVVIDNVEEALGSAHLERAITSEVWEDRLLGRNEVAKVPQRAVWLATGNNIRLRRNMARRSYWIRMDAKHARPWQRTGFRHPDLLEWASAHRGELLSALLTLCRAWFAAGKPKADVPVLGGFQEWAQTIGGVLAVARVSGFLGNLAQLHEQADAEAQEWEGFLRMLTEYFGGEAFTVATIVQRLADQPAPGALFEALPTDLADAYARAAGSFRHRLGNALRRKEGVRYGTDGIHMERAGALPRGGQALWRVCRDESTEG